MDFKKILPMILIGFLLCLFFLSVFNAMQKGDHSPSSILIESQNAESKEIDSIFNY